MLRYVFMLMPVLLLSACGFTPLYQQGGNARLAAHNIHVDVADDRFGYHLRRALEDRLGHPTSPEYILKVASRSERIGLGLSGTNVASRYDTRVTLDYVLEQAKGGTIITQGQRVVSASYDGPYSPYAVMSAAQDAEVRAAEQAAQILEVDIARALSD